MGFSVAVVNGAGRTLLLLDVRSISGGRVVVLVLVLAAIVRRVCKKYVL